MRTNGLDLFPYRSSSADCAGVECVEIVISGGGSDGAGEKNMKSATGFVMLVLRRSMSRRNGGFDIPLKDAGSFKGHSIGRHECRDNNNCRS